MKHYHLNRLLKLARHLASGKLGHVEFDFNNWHIASHYWVPVPANKCGSSGCAIGECPVAFPKKWKFRGSIPEIKDTVRLDAARREMPPTGWGSVEVSARDFFGVDGTEFNHLFLPGGQIPTLFGGRNLDAAATPKQVAQNIRAFVARKKRAAK